MAPKDEDKPIEASAADGKPGAPATFPYDRMTVARFRETFPRARWREDLNAWFVPGTTAEKRINRWLARELNGSFTYADERGRDAFAFEPIESPYLEAGEDMRIVTPYSRTIVAELHDVPWTHWDSNSKAWRVPYRSLDDLRKHWPAIEAAARRNEPHERLKRRQAITDTKSHDEAKARARERLRHRYPIPAGSIPPIGRVLMTRIYGPVVFTEIAGELIEKSDRDEYYPGIGQGHEDLIWAQWRKPTLAELVKTWPAKQVATNSELVRGWWQPTLAELRHERRKARSIERAQETRRSRQRTDR